VWKPAVLPCWKTSPCMISTIACCIVQRKWLCLTTEQHSRSQAVKDPCRFRRFCYAGRPVQA